MSTSQLLLIFKNLKQTSILLKDFIIKIIITNKNIYIINADFVYISHLNNFAQLVEQGV